MFQLNILFKFINNDVYQQNVKFTEISMRNTDIEKSELPGKNSNESTISYCLRMINIGVSSFYNNYKLDYTDIKLTNLTKKIIENKGSLKKINDEMYIYHSLDDKYYLIWYNMFGYGWNKIDIKNNKIISIDWDIENQIF